MLKDPITPQQVYIITIPSSFPEGPTEFILVIINLGKRKTHTFRKILNTRFELILISGDPKDHCGPLLEWKYMGDSQ